MDIIIAGTFEVSRNSSDAVTRNVWYICTVYKTIADILNFIAFILIIIYKKMKKTRNEDIHAPIFNQLFYISAFCVFMNSVSFVLRMASENSLTENGFYVSSLLISLLWMLTYAIIYCSIVFFSFLAGVQRMIILYLPKYKCYVVG
uniref:G_PROTEIN_RECEP_F1_2 domain-containing protein n=1 Tax=Caenorhabditis tropicalis TaxID=1561998 RepID=A0A1I7V225_9PELO